MAESFLASLKTERVRSHIHVRREGAIEEMRNFIDDFYNPVRRRRHLGGASPEMFEVIGNDASIDIQKPLGRPVMVFFGLFPLQIRPEQA
jgi:hypothetical protein